MQDGLLLCIVKCVDATTMLTRDQRVADFLANMGPEAENETGKVRSDPNEVRENN
jgi:hypothetical protein